MTRLAPAASAERRRVPRRRVRLGAICAAALLLGSSSGSGSTASLAHQEATFDDSLKMALGRIAAMGYRRNEIAWNAEWASFTPPDGVRFIGAQYTNKSPDIIF